MHAFLQPGDGYDRQRPDLRTDVQALQSHLHKIGYDPGPIDGLFGPATERVLRTAQLRFGCYPDGYVRETFWLILESCGRGIPKLKQPHLQQVADRLDIPVALVQAIDHIESASGGFLDDGRPKILFERHVFRRNTKVSGVSHILFGDYNAFSYTAGKPDGMPSGRWQWERLMRAYRLDPEAALKACSWGRYQVLGENAIALGYPTVHRFVEQMCSAERNHLEAFARFIEVNDLDKHLREKDLHAFARAYNGPSYMDNNYVEKLKRWIAHYG